MGLACDIGAVPVEATYEHRSADDVAPVMALALVVRHAGEERTGINTLIQGHSNRGADVDYLTAGRFSRCCG
jgi:hypothetical protein